MIIFCVMNFQQLKALSSLSALLKEKSGKDIAPIIPQWVRYFIIFASMCICIKEEYSYI